MRLSALARTCARAHPCVRARVCARVCVCVRARACLALSTSVGVDFCPCLFPRRHAGQDYVGAQGRGRTRTGERESAAQRREGVPRCVRFGMRVALLEGVRQVLYEGHGPAGVAVLVETMTDNRNRTGGAVRLRYYAGATLYHTAQRCTLRAQAPCAPCSLGAAAASAAPEPVGYPIRFAHRLHFQADIVSCVMERACVQSLGCSSCARRSRVLSR